MAPQAPPCPNTVTLFKVDRQTLDYTITLEGPTNNGLTWTYKVKKNSGNNLSHFDVQICFNDFVSNPTAVVTGWKILSLVDDTCIQNPPLAAGTGPDDNFKVLPSGDPAISCMSTTPLIKFNSLVDFAPVTDFCFQFTLAKCYTVGCPLIGGKAGTSEACLPIQGPSPDCTPCPTRGLGFKI